MNSYHFEAMSEIVVMYSGIDSSHMPIHNSVTFKLMKNSTFKGTIVPS